MLFSFARRSELIPQIEFEVEEAFTPYGIVQVK